MSEEGIALQKYSRFFEDKLAEANQMLEVQRVQGLDNYMHGMFNGMEFIISIMEEREPNFLEFNEYMKQAKEK